MDKQATNLPDPSPSCTRRSALGYVGAFMAGGLIAPVAKPAWGSARYPEERPDLPVFNVRQFGATGEQRDNATAAFRKALEACAAAGGGIVLVPPGAYTTGAVILTDNIRLHLMAGTTLFLSQSRQDFPKGARAMIFAENAKNISVTGKGTLDGLAQYDYAPMRGVDPEIGEEIAIAKAAGEDMRRYYRKSSAMNTYMFILNDCDNVTLEGIHVIHSPLWNVRLNDCHRVHITGVYIYSDLEKGVNADGIDICSCSNVLISDSMITTGDDAIILKSIARKGKPANPCQNITVTNCILESSSTALGIGTETEADISHVHFNNCVIRNSNKGIGINVQDGATVSNIIFSNLTIELNRRHWNWWGSAETCRFVLKKRTPSSRLGVIRDVVVENILAHPRGTSTIIGHPDQPLENIRLRQIQLKMLPEDAKDKRATDALQIEQVNGLVINDLSVEWPEQETEQKWRSALVIKDVSGLRMDAFSGRQGLLSASDPAISLQNVSDVIIRDSEASKGTGTFIYVAGNASNDIVLSHNFLRRARQPVSFEDPGLEKSVDIQKS